MGHPGQGSSKQQLSGSRNPALAEEVLHEPEKGHEGQELEEVPEPQFVHRGSESSIIPLHTYASRARAICLSTEALSFCNESSESTSFLYVLLPPIVPPQCRAVVRTVLICMVWMNRRHRAFPNGSPVGLQMGVQLFRSEKGAFRGAVSDRKRTVL